MNTFLLQVNQILITTRTQVQPSTSTYVPHQQTKIHILNPTRPTDNPTNPNRDLNPKDTNLLTPNKTNNQIKPSMNIIQNHTGPNYVT